MGLIGAGALLTNGVNLAPAAVAETPGNTQPAPPQSSTPLRVAHLTDIHISPERIAEYGMAASLNAVNGLKDKPSIIINGGDAIMNAATLTKGSIRDQWNSYHRILKSDNNLPIYNCIGNHDLFGFLLPSGRIM
jgi:predicted MPP superfamily phosphohydrolase